MKNIVSKLVCLVGPTAVGKTGLAVKLRQIFPSTLISADSRQVYRGMDVVTGKDHPRDLPLFGIDLASPSEDFSVSNWYDAVVPNLAPHGLNIVVGGTGLYVKTILQPPATLHIPPNLDLRKQLNSLTTLELVAKLSKLSPTKVRAMNNSDINNPRRLIRAIEVTTFLASHPSFAKLSPDNNLWSLTIGLLPPEDPIIYQQMIRTRVLSRLSEGALEETQQLLKFYPQELPAFSSIGYRSIISYLHNNSTRDQMIESWVHDEYLYAKRQLLYQKKHLQARWYPADQANLDSLVAQELQAWYDMTS